MAVASIVVCECADNDGARGVGVTSSEVREHVENKREYGGSDCTVVRLAEDHSLKEK